MIKMLIFVLNSVALYVAVDWWEWFSHNQSMIDLKGRIFNALLTLNILLVEGYIIYKLIYEFSRQGGNQ